MEAEPPTGMPMAAMSATTLGAVDLALCGGYLLSVLLVGLFFTMKERRERAAQRLQREHDKKSMSAASHGDAVLEEYYLGGRRIPWWALAVADVSSYIDISGTMINTALVYALGVQGMYIEIRGGLCLFLAFQLAYTGKLSRRCPVKTRGEWIKFRFGDRREAVLLRTTIAVTSMTSGVLAVTYFAVGGGKFFTEFVDVPAWWGLPPEFWAAALLMAVALLYTVASGYTTVVYTDVYQSFFIFASFLIVAGMGAAVALPDHFPVFMPRKNGDGSTDLVQFNTTRGAWATAVPSGHLHLPSDASYAMYNSFGVVIGTYLLLQTMRSASGPGGSGLQAVLATKSEREVRSQTFLAMVLLGLRWAFSGGVAVLAIHYSVTSSGDGSAVPIDPERVVPIVIDKMLPVGVKGFVLAALLAAALTTFDTTINSASSYWAVDIYQALLNPKASERQLLWNARASTLAVMLAGLLLSLDVTTINRIWGFMTIALAGGLMWPFFLSWYWARFNAVSCLSGVAAGFVAAFAIFIFDPQFEELSAFLVTSTASMVASLGVCAFTKAPSDQILRRFFRFARPPGRWGRVKHACFQEHAIREIDRENRADLYCTGLIAAAQLALYLLCVSAVARAWTQAMVLLAVLALTSPVIYFKWFLKLQNRPVGLLREQDDMTAQLLPQP